MGIDENAEQAVAGLSRADVLANPLATRRIATPDEDWAREHLRWRADAPIVDLANVVRILERHPDFKKRFKYNDMLSKVMDRGSVMVEWRVNDMTVILQERFLPEVPVDMVARALLVVSNRVAQ